MNNQIFIKFSNQSISVINDNYIIGLLKCLKMMAFCSVLILTSCKQKENRQAETENNTSQEKSGIYHGIVFTEAGGFTSGIEGPAVDANGILYAVNFEVQGTIGQVDAEGNASLFVTLPEGSIGNGIRFNSDGDMLIADYTMHNVLKVDVDTREISVYAHNDQMNQPNDLAIMNNDILFASDPDWKNSTGQIWRIKTDGSTTLLEANMGTTNGIEISPDNKTLYVNESVQRNVWAYDLSPQGDISNKRLLTRFDDFGMDGMRCDVEGNLWITRHGKGTIAWVSPEGAVLKEIQLTGKNPSNIAFGGKEGKRVFVTLHDHGNIETYDTGIQGRAWQMMNK